MFEASSVRLIQLVLISPFQTDDEFQAVLSEMKSMPPPLSAIVTPRVEAGSHMGNMARLAMPKYFSPGFLPPLMKPIMDSPPRKVRTNTHKCL